MSYKLLAAALAGFGLPMGAAVALAVLIVEGVPMGLTELSRRTGYAKSHLSLYLRTLASKGIVEQVRVGRRTYYRSSPGSLMRLVNEHLDRLRATLDLASHSLRDSRYASRLEELSRRLSELIQKG